MGQENLTKEALLHEDFAPFDDSLMGQAARAAAEKLLYMWEGWFAEGLPVTKFDEDVDEMLAQIKDWRDSVKARVRETTTPSSIYEVLGYRTANDFATRKYELLNEGVTNRREAVLYGAAHLEDYEVIKVQNADREDSEILRRPDAPLVKILLGDEAERITGLLGTVLPADGQAAQLTFNRSIERYGKCYYLIITEEFAE